MGKEGIFYHGGTEEERGEFEQKGAKGAKKRGECLLTIRDNEYSASVAQGEEKEAASQSC
jgi:hypothetical protein